jgi:hypothetical protein
VLRPKPDDDGIHRLPIGCSSSAALPLAYADSVSLAPACIAAFYAIVRAWVEAVRGRRTILIDEHCAAVTLHKVSAFFKPRSRSWHLSTFGSVVSYVTFSRFPVNRLELVTVQSGEALLLANFRTQSSTVDVKR